MPNPMRLYSPPLPFFVIQARSYISSLSIYPRKKRRPNALAGQIDSSKCLASVAIAYLNATCQVFLEYLFFMVTRKKITFTSVFFGSF